jgi:hypothetical protein
MDGIRDRASNGQHAGVSTPGEMSLLRAVAEWEQTAAVVELHGAVPMTRQIRLHQHDPCPCESGKLLRDCCLLPTGHLRKEPPSLLPPGPGTGHAQSGCYLASTMDCSRDISAEHYMSRSVLEVFGDTVAVDGVPWLPPGTQKEIGINNLAAKILCRRHNAALSALDNAAGQFARRVQFIHIDLARKSLSRKHSLVLMSGEALELWMLKAACGLFYSKNAARDGGMRLIDDHTIEDRLAFDALLCGVWLPRCGLYIRAPKGHPVPVQNSVSIAPLIAENEQRVVGAYLIVRGLEFAVIFDPTGGNFDTFANAGWLRRPTELVFVSGRRAHSIGLTWLPGTPERSITLTEGRCSASGVSLGPSVQA